jgi:hypothetical protein
MSKEMDEAVGKRQWSKQREATFDGVDDTIFRSDVLGSSFGRDRVRYFLNRWMNELDDATRGYGLLTVKL